MYNEDIKFVRFSPGKEKVGSIKLSIWKLLFIPILFFFGLVGMVGLVSKTLFHFEEQKTISALEEQNLTLSRILETYGRKTDDIEKRLVMLKDRDQHLRTFAEVPVMDDELWKLGTGGSTTDKMFASFGMPQPVMESKAQTDARISKAEVQLDLLYESFKNIEKKLMRDSSQRLKTPTIMPIKNGIVTSAFGRRKDPFIQRTKQHNGMDIVARAGTPVLAPSAGVVTLVRKHYKARETLGRVVVIDHGNGIRTRYGHLKRITVRKGQKVNRYDQIAEVGNTGRSTGPHLHYEVINDGKFRNPADYIINLNL